MILGIGIDIVNVERLEHWLTVKGLPERFFNADELAEVYRRGRGAAFSLAARFAAKEAFGKALGTGLCGITLKNISVINDLNGKPYLSLSGDAEEAFQKAGGSAVHISLTHEKNTAAAVVIIEKTAAKN